VSHLPYAAVQLRFCVTCVLNISAVYLPVRMCTCAQVLRGSGVQSVRRRRTRAVSGRHRPRHGDVRRWLVRRHLPAHSQLRIFPGNLCQEAAAAHLTACRSDFGTYVNTSAADLTRLNERVNAVMNQSAIKRKKLPPLKILDAALYHSAQTCG